MANLRDEALSYHALPTPGKIGIALTKPANTAHDLSLAYSPGVAEPVREIAANPEKVFEYTSKGNLVGVISNGSAILGLGNLGALASKPVMEGKALLFKKFANIDAIDIEVNESDPQAFIDIVKKISVSFGGINLEDIRAPECFEIEKGLIEACDIPVFHDDQHGTAIVTVAGLLNSLEIVGKNLNSVRLVVVGAGAAAISCCNLLLAMGMEREQICLLDRQGVIHSKRENLNTYKAAYAMPSDHHTLSDVMRGADIFLGLSGPDVLMGEDLKKMAKNPIVFACSNPRPEIMPEVARDIRSDIIMATGRSDYPNQVNNVLCFPFIFRGALDVRASVINEPMKIAAVHALKDIAKKPITDDVKVAYPNQDFSFGANYILPKPVDSRLLTEIPAVVAQAAIDSNVARVTKTNQ